MKESLLISGLVSFVVAIVVSFVAITFDERASYSDVISLGWAVGASLYSIIVSVLILKTPILNRAYDISKSLGRKTGLAAPFSIEYDRIFSQCIANLDDLNQGRLIKNDSEFYTDMTAGLYESAVSSIVAVSRINPVAYWQHLQVKEFLDKLNELAVEREMFLERTFVFEQPEDVVSFYDIMKSQLDDGVEVYYLVLNKVQDQNERDHIFQADYAFYDDKYVQCFSFTDASCSSYSKCTLSISPKDLSDYRGINRIIERERKPLPSAIQDLDEYETVSSHSPGLLKRYHSESSFEQELDFSLIGGITPHMRILDVGCGPGRVITDVAHFGCNIIGVERERVAYNDCIKATSNFANVSVVNSNFTDYSNTIEDAVFDLIFAINSIYHDKRDDFMKALYEINRLLAVRGHLFLSIKTVKGNEQSIMHRGPHRLKPVDNFNSYLNCNYPDYKNIHHFSSEEEINEIESIFMPCDILAKKWQPLITDPDTNDIVHGAGYLYVIKKGS